MKNLSRLLPVVGLLISAISTHAQNSGPGVSPYGSYTKGTIDSVNDQNLNIHLELEIASVTGRGLNFNYSLGNESQIWTPVTSGTTTSWTPPPAVIGDPANGFWGWRTLRPNGNITWTTTFLGTCKDTITGVTDYLYRHNNYVFLDPQGVRHTFSSVNWSDSSTPFCTFPSGTFAGYADDGTRLYLTINGQTDEIPKVIDPSGIQYTLRGWGTNTANGAHGGTVSDTNGNYISAAYVVASCTNSYNGWNWTDSAGRNIMDAVDCPTYKNYAVLGGGGYTVNLQTINIKTNFGCSGVVEYTGTATVPSSMSLPNGQSYTFSYEPTPGNSGYYTGRLQKVTLPNGGYLEYDYTGANDGINCADGTTMNLTRKVNDGTNTRVWTFSRSGSSTTVTAPQLSYDSIGNSTVYTFDSSGRETSRKLYQGSSSGTLLRTTNTTWNTQNAPASIVTILEDGSTQSESDLQYDSNRNVTSIAEYDWGTGAHGSLLRTSIYGYVTNSNYTGTNTNILNLVSDITTQDGSGTPKSRQHINYDETSAANCPTGVTQHDDTNYACSFNYRGNPTSVVRYLDPVTPGNGVTKSSTFDVFGNRLTAQLNCCQQEQWVYSSTTGYSLPDSITSGSSPGPQLTTSFAYSLDQISKTTDPNGQSTTVTYDSMFRQLVTTRPDNTQITLAYDDTNHKATLTTPITSSTSRVQVTASDPLGRPVTVTTQDASNNVYSIVQNQYDELGRLSGTSNPYTGGSASYWTTTQFDALGRPKKTILPDGTQTTYSYATNSVTVTDAAGKQKTSVADGAGRLVAVYEPDVTNSNSLTQQTTYSYNPMDDLTSVTQGAQTRTYVYDALSRLTNSTAPESGTTQFAYNNFDQVTQRTDARGVITTYSYDTLNRLYQTSYNVGTTGVPATPTVNYNWGGSPSVYNNGRLASIFDGTGNEYYTYDLLGRVTLVQKYPSSGQTQFIAYYAYNLASELTSITYPSGRVVQPGYDALGRLSNITSGGTTYQSGIQYNAAQQVTGFSYGNGVNAAFGYSPDRLQLNCLDFSGTNRGGTCAHDSSTKFGLNYGYSQSGGNNGQIASITDAVDNGRSATYTYDALYRLTAATTTGSANYPQWGIAEAYDRYGNRTAQSVTAGTNVPSSSITLSAATNHIVGGPYAYDANGNMTNDGSNTLVYDGENRVVSAAGATYAYDGNGRRVQKVSAGTTTAYFYSGTQLLSEYDATGGIRTEHIYGASQRLASIGLSTLANNGFEAGLSPWYSGGQSAQLITDSTRAHSGSNYMQLSATVNAASSVQSADTAVQPGDIVTFGGWTYLESGGGGGGSALGWWLAVKDANHNVITYAGAGNPTTAAWQFQTATYTVPQGAAFVELYAQVYLPTSSTVLRVDDGFINAGTTYYHADSLSARMLTDRSGNVVAQRGHYPFGETWYETGAITTKWKFTFYERDPESGNDYAMDRYNVSLLGRYSSPDLLGGDVTDPQSLNHYSYSLDDPLNLTDPLGLGPLPPGFPSGCYVDLIETDCQLALQLLNSGAAAGCPYNDCGPYAGANGYLYQLVLTSEGFSYINPLNGDEFTDGSELGLPSLDGNSLSVGPGGGSGNDLLKSAINKALKVLLKVKCRGLFGSNVDPVDLLNKLAAGNSGLGSITPGPVDDPSAAAQTLPITPVTGPTTFTGANIVINNGPSSPFYNGYGDRLNDDSARRAATVIHELGHAATVIYGSSASRIVNDMNDATASKANTALVLKNCF